MVPNSYVLINDGVNDSIAADAGACEIKPTWNAAVCKGDVGRLNIGGPGGGGFGGFGLVAQVPVRGGPGGPVAAAGAGGPGGRWRRLPDPVVEARLLVHGGPGGRGAGAGGTCSAASRSQPQWQGLHRNDTNVRAGTEIKVTTERPTVALTLTELDKGSWVIFELPGFTTAASGTPQNSLDALRKASDTSYFKDKDALWVKVVSTGDPGTGAPGGGTSVRSAGMLPLLLLLLDRQVAPPV